MFRNVILEACKGALIEFLGLAVYLLVICRCRRVHDSWYSVHCGKERTHKLSFIDSKDKCWDTIRCMAIVRKEVRNMCGCLFCCLYCLRQFRVAIRSHEDVWIARNSFPLR